MIDVIIPIKTVSEANSHEHWTKSAKRHNLQRKAINIAFGGINRNYLMEMAKQLPLIITLIRIAPRSLDTDNLTTAFKWIRDAIADIMFPGFQAGRADDHKGIEWRYNQQKGQPKEYAIRVTIEKVAA